MADQNIQILPLEPQLVSVRTNLLGWLARPGLQKLACLGGDLFGLVFAQLAVASLGQRILHAPIQTHSLAHDDLYTIPLFMLILFVLDAYESPALRRPEREFEIICKAVVVT